MDARQKVSKQGLPFLRIDRFGNELTSDAIEVNEDENHDPRIHTVVRKSIFDLHDFLKVNFRFCRRISLLLCSKILRNLTVVYRSCASRYFKIFLPHK